ncbi:MAG: PQQ-binding-like beta-propeller repeat protein [Planctomycetota bacterium]
MSVLAASVLAVGAAVAAQETPGVAEWPSYRGNPALHGVAEGALPDAPELAWSFETGGPILSSPVIANGAVFVGSSDGAIYAVDLATGEKRWSFATDDIVDAPPLVLGDRVYVGSADFFFYALDAATGELVWKLETQDKIVGSANWFTTPDGDPRLVFGSYDCFLYCLDPTNGEVVWTYETDNFLNGTPAVLDDRIVFGGCDTVLHVVSSQTGEAAAKVPLGADGQVAGSVALRGDRAYFGHYGNEFVAADLSAADVLWRYAESRKGFVSSPAIGTDRAVFGGRDRVLHCVGLADGAPLWTFKTRRKIDGSPVICGDKVLCGSGDGRIYLLRLEDGSEVWNYELGQSVHSTPAVAGGRFVVGCGDGRLYAFRGPADGQQGG